MARSGGRPPRTGGPTRMCSCIGSRTTTGTRPPVRAGVAPRRGRPPIPEDLGSCPGHPAPGRSGCEPQTSGGEKPRRLLVRRRSRLGNGLSTAWSVAFLAAAWAGHVLRVLDITLLPLVPTQPTPNRLHSRLPMVPQRPGQILAAAKSLASMHLNIWSQRPSAAEHCGRAETHRPAARRRINGPACGRRTASPPCPRTSTRV